MKFKFNFLKKKFDIYTDGSHKDKWGSWAYVIVHKNKIIHEASGRVRKTNSHRMEFQAAIEALSYIKPGAWACVYSDSKILIDSVLDPGNRPQVNIDQSHQIDQLISKREISWKWVKAHSGIAFNERCDQLCTAARENN